MNHIPKLSREELHAIQRDPKVYFTRKNDLSNKDLKNHLDNFRSYLFSNYPVTNGSVEWEFHYRERLPKRVCDDSQVGIAHCWKERAVIHVAIKGMPLFQSMGMLAHEYRHAIQIVQQQRHDADTHELEVDAITFQYDVLCQYLKETYL